MCLFGEILERMENLGEKSEEKEVLMGVWLEGRVEKNVMKSRCFLPEPPKNFLPKIGREVGGDAH